MGRKYGHDQLHSGLERETLGYRTTSTREIRKEMSSAGFNILFINQEKFQQIFE